jgi:hypothetical protein
MQGTLHLDLDFYITAVFALIPNHFLSVATGLGNRLVAIVSGFLLSVCTDRALLIDWEAYSDHRVHRSQEVSTMAPLDQFLRHDVAIESSVILSDAKVCMSVCLRQKRVCA